jgi:hypothetical protein
VAVDVARRSSGHISVMNIFTCVQLCVKDVKLSGHASHLGLKHCKDKKTRMLMKLEGVGKLARALGCVKQRWASSGRVGQDR